MPGGRVETHRDDSAFATGTHKNLANSAFLNDPGKDFKSCGVQVDSLIRNTTDGSEGAITAVTEDTVSVTLAGGTDNDWDIGDEYEIYITDTYDSIISSVWTDKRYGRKYDKDKLHKGLIPDDIDIDEYRSHVWGPNQPEKRHDGR